MSAVLDSEWLSELSSMELMQLFLVSKLMNHVDSSSCLSVYSGKTVSFSCMIKHELSELNQNDSFA